MLRKSWHYLQDYVSDQTEHSQERDFNGAVQLSEVLAVKYRKKGRQTKGNNIRTSAEPQQVQTGKTTYKCR